MSNISVLLLLLCVTLVSSSTDLPPLVPDPFPKEDGPNVCIVDRQDPLQEALQEAICGGGGGGGGGSGHGIRPSPIPPRPRPMPQPPRRYSLQAHG